MKNKKSIAVLISVLFILASCSNGKSLFVVKKKTLDPLTIYQYSPLVLPPVYYLSSQEISDERRFLKHNRNTVHSLLFDDNINTNTRNSVASTKTSTFNPNNFTPSERALLKLAKADQDFYDIRDKLNKETLGIIKKQNSFIGKIFSKNQGESLDDTFRQYEELNSK